MKSYKILLLPGDGIGPEIMEQAKKVLLTISNLFSVELEVEYSYIGGTAIDKFNVPLPDETLKIAKESDAVLLGSVGGPKWDSPGKGQPRPEDGLLSIRKSLNLYANLRPIKVYNELIDSSPLKPEVVRNTDLLIVRELTGGIYFGDKGRKDDYAYDNSPYSRNEIERTVRLAFSIAVNRNKQLTLVDKANVLETSRLWREVFYEISEDYPEIKANHLLVDNAAMQLVRRPSTFDVIVTENMFGDILSDEVATICGSIGLLASASMGSSHPYLYEPIHGSAPDIAGGNLANPLAMILSTALMFRYSFKEEEAASLIENSIENIIKTGYRTHDLAGGKVKSQVLGTNEMGDMVVEELTNLIKKRKGGGGK